MPDIMGAKVKNLRVTRRVDVPVGAALFDYEPGDYAVTEHIADRVVAAGAGVRLVAKGQRLKALQQEKPDEAE